MSPRPPADSPARPYEVAIVGNDAVLAALPSRPMQLAHALLACGFDHVVPVSWGEELVAEHVVRVVAERGGAPAIFCACPLLRSRLLAAGSELAPHLVAVVPPAVATARYLRATHPGIPLRITLIGGCPGLRDVSIDSRITPLALLQMLSDRGLSLVRQPAVFESVIPPDRRRFLSLPGGCPTPRALETRAPERRLVTITDVAFATELADHLLGQENVLVDLSNRLGCACCGGFGGRGHRGPVGREEILRHEPPRARSPIVDHDIALALHVGHEELVSSTARRVDDEVESDDMAGEDAGHLPRLPDAHTSDVWRQRVERQRAEHGGGEHADGELRSGEHQGTKHRGAEHQRVERQRIAVTPATAVPAVSSRRSAFPPRSAPGWRTDSASPRTPTSRSERSARAVGAPAAPGLAPADASTSARSYAVPSDMPPTEDTAPRHADVSVPLTPQREGMPERGEELSHTGQAPLTHERSLHDAGRASPQLVATTTHNTPGGVGSTMSSGESHAPTRGSGPTRIRFRLCRSQLNPRVRSLEGQVLPRAYIRHCAAPARRDTTASGESSFPAAPGEVELRLDVSVEAAFTPTPRAPNDTILDTRAGVAPDPADVRRPASLPQPDGIAEPRVAAEMQRNPRGTDVATRDVRSIGDARGDRDMKGTGVPAATPTPDARRDREPSRTDSPVAIHRERRAPRSLAVILATIVLVAALLVFFGILFRGTP